MSYLEVKLESQGVQRSGDPNTVVSVDYAHVTTALAIAHQAANDPSATKAETELANALHSLAEVITEIVRGLHYGRLTVVNYPYDGAHLEE